jgi:hypothetical protein
MMLVRESFGGNLQNIPIPAHIEMLMSYWDRYRELTFQRLVNPTDGQALAIFSSDLTGGPIGINLAVERDAPHRIVALWPLNQLRQPMPEEARSTTSIRQLSDRQIARELRIFTERLARADVFSGVVALARGGVLVFEGAYGESNKEPHIENRLTTKFNVASMGKMFTASTPQRRIRIPQFLFRQVRHGHAGDGLRERRRGIGQALGGSAAAPDFPASPRCAKLSSAFRNSEKEVS